MSAQLTQASAGGVIGLTGACSNGLPPPSSPSSVRQHKPMDEAELVVVGCVRNGARTIRRAVDTLARATTPFASVRFLIIESDSVDGTVAELRRLRDAMPNLEFTSLGPLRERIAERSERIAACRNRYLDELRNDPRYATVDYVMVADLDGVNDDLTAEAVANCWASNLSWDVVTANQKDAYYDIWALRHPAWCPYDCRQ
jgi:glycosyltransferase involved in cell wall biosynthesis